VREYSGPPAPPPWRRWWLRRLPGRPKALHDLQLPLLPHPRRDPSRAGLPATGACPAATISGLANGLAEHTSVSFLQVRTCRGTRPGQQRADFVAKVWRPGGVSFFRTVQASFEKSCGGPTETTAHTTGDFPSRAATPLDRPVSSRWLSLRLRTH
jgi:hypothetical protein